MNRFRKIESNLFALVAATMIAVSITASAQVSRITNVSASASSLFSADSGHPLLAVNGAGLIGEEHTNVWAGYMWIVMTNAYQSIDGAYFIVDLKKNYQLASNNTLKVWNFNDVQSQPNTRGMKTAAFSSSTNGLTFQDIPSATTDATNAPATFDIAPGTPGYTNYNRVHFNTNVIARYIKITANGAAGAGNYGDAQYVGLSEVQAFGVFVSDPTNRLGAPIVVSNVTASSSYAGAGPANLLGPGLTNDLVHSVSYLEMWLTALGVNRGYVTFDFGVPRNLGAARIWNYNQNDGNNESFRGMRTVKILVSDDAAFAAGVITNHNDIVLMIGNGAAGYNSPQIVEMNRAQGRYVRISNMDTTFPTWGETADLSGLSEVQFFDPGPRRGTVFTIE